MSPKGQVTGTAAEVTGTAAEKGPSPREGTETLRPGGADEGRRVPAGVHGEFLDVHAGLGRVDDVAAAHVHGDVTHAVVVQQVAGLDGGRGDVRQGGPLLVGVARDG